MSEISDLYKLFLAHSNIQIDTRRLQRDDLFFALKGSNFDGNTFAEKALEMGAAYAIIDNWELSKKSDRFFYVDDVLLALQQLARYHRLQFTIPIIAITGSNGKTTTKELMHAVLSKKYKTSATIGNLNNHIGVPLTLLKLKKDTQIALIEMGANHQEEIAFYCEIALPNYGLITNCGKAHLEGFGGIEGVKKGKGELYDFIRNTQGSIFRNANYDYLEEMAEGITEQITYGTNTAQIIGKSIPGSSFLNIALLTSGMETTLKTHLVGDYNLPNVLAAVAVGNYFSLSIEDIKAAIEDYKPDNNRSQWVEKGNNKIILDAYNANPSSMRLAIENMAQTEAKEKWLILGGMKELGEAGLEEHQNIVDLTKSLNLNNVLLCGPEFEKTQHNYPWFLKVEDLLLYLQQHPIKKALILIKGSRTTGMEGVLPAF